MAINDKLARLRAQSTKVNAAYSSDIVRKGVVTNIPRIPTGSVAADYVFGVNEAGSGGWAVGHGNCIVGWQSCIAGDAEVLAHRAGKSFRLTMSEFVRRFNGGVAGGKTWRSDIPTKVQGMDDLRGRLHTVVNACSTGVKSVVRVTTDSGRSVVCTPDHEFWTPAGWARIESVGVGGEVYAVVKPPSGRKATSTRYRVVYGVGNHPQARGHHGKPASMMEHRLVVEAGMNAMSLEEYVAAIRAGAPGLVYLSMDMEVHHRNLDKADNSIGNLRVMSISDHKRLHAEIDGHRNVLWVGVTEKIVSIVPAGEVEVFDITVMEDSHNFTANGFVVHNSGKTTLSLKACGNLQRMCVRCYRPAVDVKVVRLLDDDGKPVMVDAGFDKDGILTKLPLYTVAGRCSCYKEGLWTPGKAPELKGNVGEKKEQAENWSKHLASLVENSFEAATIVFGDVENTLDMKWARRHGVLAYAWDEEHKAWCQVAQFVHVVPNTAEQAIDIFDEYIGSGAVDLLVVDSVPALVPKEEVEASAEDMQRGVAARLVNKAFRRWVGSQARVAAQHDNPREVTIIYIQQWRKGMGAFAENVMPAGNGQLFAYSIITEVFTKDKEIEGDDALAGHSDKDGTKGSVALRICVKNRKNKTFPPYKESSFRMLLKDADGLKPGNVDEAEYLFKSALMLDIAEKNGSKYKFRGIEYTAQSQVVAVIEKQPNVRAWVEREIRKKLYIATEGDS